MAANNPAGFLQNAGSTHTAEQMRNWFAMYVQGRAGATSLMPRQGVNPSLGNALTVTQSGSPAMSVVVKSGHAVIAGTEGSKQGVYMVMNDADVTLTIAAAHATLNRIDSVIFKIEDQAYSGGVNTSSLVVVTGTPAASPSPPTLPANSLELARVSVVALDTQITNNEITDTRPFFVATGGVIPCTTATRPTQVYDGMVIYDSTVDLLLVYDIVSATWKKPSSGGIDKISENILVGSAASVTFSSIPSGYRGLLLQVQARGDTAAANTSVGLRFNGDSSAIYDQQTLLSAATTVAASESINATSASLGDMAANTATAGAAGAFSVMIPNYAGTTFWKQFISGNQLATGTGTGTIHDRQFVGRWRSTAAVNQITLTPAAGNFVAGSTFVLYGMGA